MCHHPPAPPPVFPDLTDGLAASQWYTTYACLSIDSVDNSVDFRETYNLSVEVSNY
jgi:hypothetical protein